MSKWLNNLKRIAPRIRYMVVPELHKDGKSYHFHGLISETGDMCILDSGKKDRSGKTIYNLLDFKYGWTTATRVQDNNRVSSYITKYLTKDLIAVTKGKKRYWCSRNCEKPNIISYNIVPEEIEEIVDSLSENITNLKSMHIPLAGQHIRYIEIAN